MWFTGLTYRQVDYWDATGLLRPSISAANGSGSQRRYSISDVHLARTMKRLLDAGVSLQRIRGVSAALMDLPEDADAFAVIGDEVTVVHTGEELAAAVMSAKIAHVVRLRAVREEGVMTTTAALCSACKAPIEWVVVAKSGKRMPIDVAPVADGNLIKGLEPLTDGTWTVSYLKKDDQADSMFGQRETYVSHFATCPAAGEFRKKKR